MAENGLNSRRALWAVQYQSAPRRRFFTTTTVNVLAGAVLDITNICPTRADLHTVGGLVQSVDPAVEFYDLLVTALISTLEAGLVGVGMSHSLAVAPVVPQYPYLGEEETEGIRVRGLFPRAAAADVVLDTPMVDAAGAAVPNRVFIVNGNGQAAVDVQLVFEIPDLNWV